LSDVLRAGAGVQWARSNESGIHESTTSLTAGLLFTPAFRVFSAITPSAAVAVLTRTDGVRWSGGVDFALPEARELSGHIGYGVRGGEDLPGPEHRVGLTATWRGLVSASVGVMNGTGGEGRVWEPTLGASLHVNRYELGVLRESLANDFGAAYSFRLRVGID
jgi:hypothetical protein